MNYINNNSYKSQLRSNIPCFFLNMLIDSEFFMFLFDLDQITGPVYRILMHVFTILLIN